MSSGGLCGLAGPDGFAGLCGLHGGSQPLVPCWSSRQPGVHPVVSRAGSCGPSWICPLRTQYRSMHMYFPAGLSPVWFLDTRWSSNCSRVHFTKNTIMLLPRKQQHARAPAVGLTPKAYGTCVWRSGAGKLSENTGFVGETSYTSSLSLKRS